MKRTLGRSTPDIILEKGGLRAAIYEMDLALIEPATAPLLVTHTFGRIGAAFPALPEHAHYLNLYIGDGISDEIRNLLFPEILDAAHSVSVQGRPAKPFSRAHGVLLEMKTLDAQRFFPGTPPSVEMFEVGDASREVERHGFSVALEDATAFDDYARERGARLVWLTPRPSS